MKIQKPPADLFEPEGVTKCRGISEISCREEGGLVCRCRLIAGHVGRCACIDCRGSFDGKIPEEILVEIVVTFPGEDGKRLSGAFTIDAKVYEGRLSTAADFQFKQKFRAILDVAEGLTEPDTVGVRDGT